MIKVGNNAQLYLLLIEVFYENIKLVLTNMTEYVMFLLQKVSRMTAILEGCVADFYKVQVGGY